MTNSKISLKKFIFSLVFSISALVIIIQLFCVSVMLNMFDEQKTSSLNSMVAQSAMTIENKLNTIFTLEEFISSNSNVKNILSKEASPAGSTPHIDFNTDVMFLNRFLNDKISIILTDNDSIFESFLIKSSQEELATIKKLYAEYQNDTTQSLKLFTVNSGAYSELFICSFHPITYFTTDLVGSKSIGTSIVVNRINIYQLLMDMEYADNSGLIFSCTDNTSEISFMGKLNTKNALMSEPVKIHNTSYTISGAMHYKSQNSSIFKIIVMIVIELIIVILLFLFIHLSLLNKFITAPIKKIVKFMDNFTLHNTKERLDNSYVSEFSVLSHHINTMLDNSEAVLKRIVYTQQKLYESELSEKDAVFYALQNQINPHFLYNTLESINGLAVSKDTEKVTQTIDSLSKILRYALDYNSETTVDNEIYMLTEYSKILKVRFQDKIDIIFDFDDDIWECKILRMMLQPIVENSVKHGFNNLTKDKLTINISGVLSENNLIFTIHDDGCGISPIQLAQLNKQLEESVNSPYSGSSIGLANIHRRIILRYGEEYKLKIESRHGEFTCVTVKLPIF